jgi:L-glutamine-phosphate cytidylyltransferase
MKAIILAAGQGTRLAPLTDDRPKCLVELAGRPLLDHQVAVLQKAGIDAIHVIAGYRAERIVHPAITRHLNPDYAVTNMVATLFSARHLLQGPDDVIISYGDIVYEHRVLAALMACPAELCLAADRQWRRYWQARMDDPLADAETFRLDGDGHVIELGRKPRSEGDIQAQYMGLIKVRADRLAAFTAAWDDLDRSRTYDGRDVPNMFMTSFLQHLIDTGWPVRAVLIDNGWLEVDAPEDLALADAGFWRAEG